MSNAIMVLQELSVKLGWRLTWTQHPPVGPSHAPLLTVQCQLVGEGLPNALDILGKAGNGKMAKQEAARQMLFHPDVISALTSRQLLRYVQHLEQNPTQALLLAATSAATPQTPLLLTDGSAQAAKDESAIVPAEASGDAAVTPTTAEATVTPSTPAATATSPSSSRKKKKGQQNPNNFKGYLGELLMKASAKLRTLEGVTDQSFKHEYKCAMYGPSHHVQFVCTVTVWLPHDQIVEARGVGRVKRESEHIAAYHALQDPKVQELELVLAQIKRPRTLPVATVPVTALHFGPLTTTTTANTVNTAGAGNTATPQPGWVPKPSIHFPVSLSPSAEQGAGEVLALTDTPHNDDSNTNSDSPTDMVVTAATAGAEVQAADADMAGCPAETAADAAAAAASATDLAVAVTVAEVLGSPDVVMSMVGVVKVETVQREHSPVSVLTPVLCASPHSPDTPSMAGEVKKEPSV